MYKSSAVKFIARSGCGWSQELAARTLIGAKREATKLLSPLGPTLINVCEVCGDVDIPLASRRIVGRRDRWRLERWYE